MTSQPTRSQPADPNTCTSDFLPAYVAQQAIALHGAQQNAQELAVLLAYLALTEQPKVIIELGTGSGGLAWALDQLPSHPKVLSVSLPDASIPDVSQLEGPTRHLILGDTHDPKTFHDVTTWLGDRLADVLVIDADHTYASARQDWLEYGSLVRFGGLVVFHDIAQAFGFPDVQVHELWAQIRGAHRTLEIVAEPAGLAGYGLLWVD